MGCPADIQRLTGPQSKRVAGFERVAVAMEAERGPEDAQAEIDGREEGRAGQRDFEGRGERGIPDEGVAQGHGGAVGGPAHGDAQPSGPRPAGIHNEGKGPRSDNPQACERPGSAAAARRPYRPDEGHRLGLSP